MKRYLVLLAALASICVIGSAGASSAFAGNCTSVSAGNTFYDGQMAFTAYVGNCNAVTYVEFGQGTGTGVSSMGAWWDASMGRLWLSTSIESIGQPELMNPQSRTATATYRHAPWCAGQVDQVYTIFNYRIKSISPSGVQTWGSWHGVNSVQYGIVC